MDRRTFLKSMAATPLVFGLRDLLGQDEKPDWWKAALKRMKETGRNGIVLVAPKATKDRVRFGEALLARIDGDNPDAANVFCEAVVICCHADLAPWKENRALLDPDGKRIGADAVALEVYEDSAKFAESFQKFLHGAKNERLEERAGAIRVPPEAKEALDKLESDDFEEREAATSTLAKLADTIAPWLVWMRMTCEGDERRSRLRDVLRRWMAARKPDEFGARLPFGAKRHEFIPGCGGIEDEEEGVAVDCGMARAPQKSRHFLRFLAK